MVDYAMELQLKLTIALDKIDTFVQETRMKVEDKNLTDKDGNPMEVYRKTRFGFSEFTIFCNGKSISFVEFLTRWKAIAADRNSGNFSLRDAHNSDDCPTLTFSQLFYRKDWLEIRLKELKDFFVEIFDIDLNIN
jgi:hypothetical protein